MNEFYDERIEKEKGNISKNGILFSVLISLFIGGMRFVNIMKNTGGGIFYVSVLLEGVIALSGILCLLISFFKYIGKYIGKQNDEMLTMEKAKYYNQAVRYHLGVSVLAFAVLLPIVTRMKKPNLFMDMTFDSIILLLFYLLFLYVHFACKKKDIYFNYSLMENEHYYSCVFKNIAVLGGYMAGLFVISFSTLCICMLAKQRDSLYIGDFIGLFAIYLMLFLLLSLLYLFCSYLEKASYDSERAISKATAITLFLSFLICLFYTGIVISLCFMEITQAQRVQLFSSVLYVFKFFGNLLFLMFLVYFSYEYSKKHQNRLLLSATKLLLGTAVLDSVLSALQSGMTSIFLHEYESDMQLLFLLSDILSIKNGVLTVINMAAMSLIFIALVKDRFLAKGNLAAIPTLLILHFVEIFLQTQTDSIGITLYQGIEKSLLLCYLTFVLMIASKRIEKKIVSVY